jgi:quercetin dioxygenase-like cupin family protein
MLENKRTLTDKNFAMALSEKSGVEWLTAGPGEHYIRIPAAATDGAYSMTEMVLSPGSSTPLHVHAKEDEYILVLEGTARIVLGEKTFDAAAGQNIELKLGIPMDLEVQQRSRSGCWLWQRQVVGRWRWGLFREAARSTCLRWRPSSG